MFGVSGSFKLKTLDRLTPDRVQRALKSTIDRRATTMAAEATDEFRRGVQRASEVVEQTAAEDKEAVPEETLELIEAGRNIEFTEELDSSLSVAGEAEARVVVKEGDTPAGPAPLVARSFEYGSAARSLPTVPTFRSISQRETNRAGQTLMEAREKL